MKIRAMTFNIQHTVDFLRQDLNPELMANTILSVHPDFCVLNEVYGHCEEGDPVYDEQIEVLSKLTGMEYRAFCPAKIAHGSPYGNAILSYKPFSIRNHIIPDPPTKEDPTKWYETRAIFSAEFDEFCVLGAHYGLACDEQRNAVKTTSELIDSRKKPLIFCGDLNMTPDNERLKPIYERLTDTAVKFPAPRLSFPSDNPTIKIDFIFVSNEFKILSADILPVISSDHRPHYAELEL